ncbi:MAG: hypothetical protein OXU20_24075 [Myxococcales bacterium]|nr:hypothetical protein [Myxococcales bacterium]
MAIGRNAWVALVVALSACSSGDASGTGAASPAAVQAGGVAGDGAGAMGADPPMSAQSPATPPPSEGSAGSASMSGGATQDAQAADRPPAGGPAPAGSMGPAGGSGEETPAAGSPDEGAMPSGAGDPGDPGDPGGGPAPAGGAALEGSCPDGFMPTEGMNTGFPSGGKMRDFHAWAAEQGEGPRPMFVSLTGTVQEEVGFARQAGLRQLTADGWIVVGPVRSCSQEGRNCSTTGSDGRVWEPWYDGTFGGGDDAGPDVAFVEEMVRCVASVWPVAADRIYTGGISAGGSFTNRNMTFNSDFFAGGVAASGNWTYGVPPRSPMPMDSSIVVIIWGGPSDMWPGSPPYAGETKAAAEYYAAQSNVVTVACSGTHGHRWPAAMTPWLVETLLSHPKGSDPSSFMLTDPPAGYTCVLGPYTDH